MLFQYSVKSQPTNSMKPLLLIVSVIIAVATPAQSQGFINLGFESANVQVNNPTYGFLNWNLAVPGWSHGAGSDSSIVYYRNPHAGITPYYLLVDSISPVYAPGTQLAGNYSLAFASGRANSQDFNSAWINSYISQTGNISPSALSVRLLATGAPFKVFVGGAEIPMFSLGGNSYGGNIAGFAGTLSELKIMNNAPVGALGSALKIDNILFSSVAIPEPSSLTLVALGLISGLVLTKKRTSSRT